MPRTFPAAVSTTGLSDFEIVGADSAGRASRAPPAREDLSRVRRFTMTVLQSKKGLLGVYARLAGDTRNEGFRCRLQELVRESPRPFFLILTGPWSIASISMCWRGA